MKHDSEGSVELSLAAWPHWPGNCSVDQVNFCLRDLRASDSQVLELVRVTYQHTLSPSSSLSSSSFSGSSFFLFFFFLICNLTPTQKFYSPFKSKIIAPFHL